MFIRYLCLNYIILRITQSEVKNFVKFVKLFFMIYSLINSPGDRETQIKK